MDGYSTNGKKLLGELGKTKALPSLPFSDQAAKRVYHGLLMAGMADETARAFASGEFDGVEVTEVLSDEDLAAFSAWFGTLVPAP